MCVVPEIPVCIAHKLCLCFCMSEVFSPFRSLRAGSQVFALLMLFRCVILHAMWLGKGPAIAMHHTLWYIVFVCHQNNVCENYIGSVYVGGYSGLSKSKHMRVP